MQYVASPGLGSNDCRNRRARMARLGESPEFKWNLTVGREFSCKLPELRQKPGFICGREGNTARATKK